MESKPQGDKKGTYIISIYNKVEFMTCDKLGTSARDRENQKIYFKKQKIKS